jgi:hypothetical protein
MDMVAPRSTSSQHHQAMIVPATAFVQQQLVRKDWTILGESDERIEGGSRWHIPSYEFTVFLYVELTRDAAVKTTN